MHQISAVVAMLAPKWLIPLFVNAMPFQALVVVLDACFVRFPDRGVWEGLSPLAESSPSFTW